MGGGGGWVNEKWKEKGENCIKKGIKKASGTDDGNAQYISLVTDRSIRNRF